MHARIPHIAVAVALLCALLALFFGEVLFGGAVYYPGDIARIYLPQRAALQQALRAGQLPWWSSALGAGYPLLAEGEVGALYPLNWLLYALLPLESALNLSIMFHYLLSGLGLYVLARELGLSRPASVFGALSWALGGFCIAHLSHISMLSAVAWLPWMLVLTHRVLAAGSRPGRARWSASGALSLVVGMQFLAGHPQMALLNLLAVGLYATALLVSRRDSRRFRVAWPWLAALLVGLVLGLPQLLPAYELGMLSQRAGGLEGEFFTSYSFHPFLVATYVSPFVLGNPYPQGSVELMGYVGLLPLALASVAVWASPRRLRWFLVALAGIGLALAFGRWNPLYRYLRLVPVLNLFRVPARYLCWTSLALALLAALGIDVLYKTARIRAGRLHWVWGACAGVALVAIAGAVLASDRDAEALTRVWGWLPMAFAAVTAVVLWMARRTRPALWASLAVSVLVVDLYAYGALLDLTYNATSLVDSVRQEPLSVSILRQDTGLYRIYTKEDILPALAPLRESLYANTALTYDLPSANLYLPLVPEAYGEYVARLDAPDLNLLNVKYYLIPQLLPVDEARELYDVTNPFSDLPIDRWLAVPETVVSSLTIESYLSHSADLPDGALAAQLILRDEDGQETVIPLRAGIETSEWAYERSDVAEVVTHARAPVASTWPARSGSPPEDHVGHTYLATIELDTPLRLHSAMLHTVLPEAFVRVGRVRLSDGLGGGALLTHLLGLGDHSIVYRSEDVLIYRNNDVLPRAFLIPATEARRSGAALTLPTALATADILPVQMVHYADQRVTLGSSSTEDVYLVLTDLAYPGWVVTVDGRDATLLRVDGVFRGVALSPGDHEIMFAFSPRHG